MRRTYLLVGIGILATACLVLVLTHGSPTVAGLPPEQFARLAQGAALLLVLGSGLVYARGRPGSRLMAAAFWLALAVALVFGYETMRE
jgi:hypothetical protein